MEKFSAMDAKVLKMAFSGVVGVSICLVLLLIPISWGDVYCGRTLTSEVLRSPEDFLGSRNLVLFGVKCEQLKNLAKTQSILLGGIGICYLLRGFVEKRSSQQSTSSFEG